MATLDLLTERAPRTHLNLIEASIHGSGSVQDRRPTDAVRVLQVTLPRAFAGWTTAGGGTGPTALARPTGGRRFWAACSAVSARSRRKQRPTRGWNACRSNRSTGQTSYFFIHQGTWEQMCEVTAVHRSLYHLKEDDPCLEPIPG